MRLFTLFFLFISLLPAYIDSDMDGVPDKSDQCAHTPLTELVDLSGCTIKKLVSDKKNYNFDIVLGQSYVDDGLSTLSLSSLKIDYYYTDLSIQLAISYYDSSLTIANSSGQNDTYLNLFYLFTPLDNFFLTLSGGLIFPTYDFIDNKIDYTASLYGRYKFDDWSLMMGMGYNKIGDIDATNSFNYQNTFSYNVGVGYAWKNGFYSSLGYYLSSSTFESVEDLEKLSLYAYYPFDKHWFSSFNYGHGIVKSGKRENIGVNLGYYW